MEDPEDLQLKLTEKTGRDELVRMVQNAGDLVNNWTTNVPLVSRDDLTPAELVQVLLFYDEFITSIVRLEWHVGVFKVRAVDDKELLVDSEASPGEGGGNKVVERDRRRDPVLAAKLQGHLVGLKAMNGWVVGQNDIMIGLTADAANNVGVDDVIDYLAALSGQLETVINGSTMLKQRADEVHASLNEHGSHH